MLRERIITGALLLVLALLLLKAGGIFVQTFILVLYCIAAYEFGAFRRLNDSAASLRYALILSLLPVSYWCAGSAGAGVAAAVVVMMLLGGEVFRLERGVHAGFPMDALSHVFLGVGYVGILGTMLFAISGMYSSRMLLCLMLLVASADTGAYFGGRAIGGKKLAPRISPKKTVSGAICGIVSACAASLLFYHYTGSTSEWSIQSVAVSVTAGILVSVLALVGDLAESLIKRTFDVKDSGTILPGHGGVLDRIDGLLFAAPALLLFGGLFP